ncbi:GDYXXLXY domain-containing protein [Pleionea sp. CnH1-48]|uniref:GDYXXLXY domain-containing protein n=1 Tax=Pleionea sp. CnH1-48 TaxID=2954494 RepID=UPI0020968FF4|nr:GDYXXLXY domain-containing protein [Pleionea sp. CnH1-48]MCO7226458.1 GDYXXLXY domain-containing protein [Pleionea sp. CnH1-48]
MKNKVLLGLVGVVAFQFFVLTGMYVKAAMPLWTGTEVKVKTIPVDPRSLFRGNYARLRYDFDRIDAKYFENEEKLRNGEVVYVTLKQGNDNLYHFDGATLELPKDGVFLRGRVVRHGYYENRYKVNYGIDAFFAPKEEALALEKDLRDGGIAVLMVDKGGRARIKEVIGQGAVR